MSDRTFRTRAALMGDRVDELTAYQASAEQTLEDIECAKTNAAESASVATLAREVVRLSEMIDAQAAEIVSLRADARQAVADALDDIVPRLCDLVDKTTAKLEVNIAERYGEVIGRIAALDPATVRATPRAATGFKFATERSSDDQEELDHPHALVVPELH